MRHTTEATGPVRAPQRCAPILHPPSGWMLDPCCHLDEAVPGFLRFITISPPQWRHAVALAVANRLLDNCNRFIAGALQSDVRANSSVDGLAHVAALLMSMEPKAIVEASFGYCPPSLVGALRKLGFDPLSPEAFLALNAIMRDPMMIARRRAIRQLPRLDQELLEAACILDPIAVSPSLVMRARTGVEAERFNRLIEAVRHHCSAATESALSKSLSDLSPNTSLDVWARAWLARADQNIPSPPWEGGQGLIPLMSGRLLNQAALKTRTCIRTRLQYVLAGRAVYYLDAQAAVIACVIRTTKGWLTTQVVGTGNGPVPEAARNRVFAVLEANGIPCFRPAKPMVDLGLADHHPWDLGEFELDDLDDGGR